jgi:translation initiation factor IF-2
MDKNKKKTLTISSDLKKKIDTTSISTSGKKSFSVEKRKPFRPNKPFNKTPSSPNINFNPDSKKKNFARKFIEQQATKDFIKKDNKPAGKSKLKLKGPVDKRDFKLTVSRALNVEEIEIKQRSLASVKRARLKEKKKPDGEEKKEFKKVIKRSKNS